MANYNPADNESEAGSTAPRFYSKLTRAIEQKMGERATAEQLRALVLNAGVKQEELEWYDLASFLQSNPKPSRTEFLNYLHANALEITEVWKGQPEQNIELTKKYEEIRAEVFREMKALPKEELDTPAERLKRQELASRLAEANEKLHMLVPGYFGGESNDHPKFEKYQLPDGENYRELLFTLPPRGNGLTTEGKSKEDLMLEYGYAIEQFGEGWEIRNGDGDFMSAGPTRDAAIEKIALADVMKYGDEVNTRDFVSSHWNERNVLAHVRLNDRTIGGKKVLFIEEVQSDWHQRGRRKGYDQKLTELPPDYKIHEGDKGFWITRGQLQITSSFTSKEDAIKDALEYANTGEVPDAPFKKTWHEYVMKRMVRFAAEHGYDSIAWTTGAQQAERYDLSKEIKHLDYKKRADGTFDVTTQRDGRGHLIGEGISADELADYVGKDVADKIISGAGRPIAYHGNNEPENFYNRLTGIDLKIGGEGMVGFYDQMLPAFINKFTKRWGGRVEELNISARGVWIGRKDGEVKTAVNFGEMRDLQKAGFTITDAPDTPADNILVHSLSITPEIRTAALVEGFVLFDRGGQVYNAIRDGGIMNNNNKTASKMFLKYGKANLPIASVTEASRIWSEIRTEVMRQGGGPSDMTMTPEIIDAAGKMLGTVSWNGKVWRGDYRIEPRTEWTDEEALTTAAGGEGRQPNSLSLGASPQESLDALKKMQDSGMITVEGLIAAGGTDWEINDEHRVEFAAAGLSQVLGIQFRRDQADKITGADWRGRELNQATARKLYSALNGEKFYYNVEDKKFHYAPAIAEYARLAIDILRGKADESIIAAEAARVEIPGERFARKNETLVSLKAERYTYVRDVRLKGPADVAEIYQDLKNIEREKFIVMSLDGENKIIGTEVVSVGTLNYNLVHPREVFKTPIMLGAKKVVFLHNHPSGINEPSEEDHSLTRRLVNCGKTIGIEMAFHVVVGNDSWAAIHPNGNVEKEKLYFTEADENATKVPEYTVYQKVVKTKPAILKPRDAVEAAKSVFEKDAKANIAFMMNTRNEVLGIVDISGLSNGEILKQAVCMSAASFVICSGEKYESVKLMQLVRDTKQMGIEVLDLVEVNGKTNDGIWQFSSRKQQGTLREPTAEYSAAGEAGGLYKAADSASKVFEKGDLYQPDLFAELSPEPVKEITEPESVKLLTEKELLTNGEKASIVAALEGAGGRAAAGAAGRGLLDEYYTPEEVVNKAWAAVDRYFDMSGTALSILEPSIGVGRFFQGKEIHPDSTITGYEINPTAAKAARLLLGQGEESGLVNVLNQPFEAAFMDERGKPLPVTENYDLVVGNPPYGDHRGRYKGLGEEENIHEYSEYFLKRALDVTKEGGLVALVMPSGFLRNKENYAKTEIAKNGNLIEAYRLPNGIFPTTDIGTDLVIFQKNTTRELERKLSKLSGDTYFKSNPENIIGAAEQRKNRFGDMEQFVKGDVLDLTNYILPEKSEEYVPGRPGEAAYHAAKQKPAAEKRGKRAPARELAQEIIESKKADKTIPVGGALVNGIELDLWVNTDADGAIRPGFMAGQNVPALKGHINYYKGNYFNNFNYFQGDIYEKLKTLEEDFKNDRLSQEFYQKQRAGLEAVIPTPATIKDIRLLPIDPLATEIVFPEKTTLQEEFEIYLDILPHEAFEDSSVWEVRSYLEGRSVTGFSPERNADERRRRKEVAEKLFNKFLKEELPAEKQAAVLKEYNERRNAVHQPDYSKVPLISRINATFKGDPVKLRHYQTSGVGFLVNKGVGCLAHEVGAGKTMSAIIAVNELLQRGWIQKPLVVVPKGVYKKWIAEISDIIPGVKINALGNLTKKYVAGEKLVVEPGTITVITTEGMNRLGFKKETYDGLLGGLHDTIAGFNTTKRQQAGEKEKADEMIGKGIKGTSDKFFFEDIGFDQLVLDEMHRYKNIFVSAKMEKGQANEYRNVRGGRSSARAVKVYLATQYVLNRHNGRGVIGLTATPFSNSPIEYYSIMSLLAKRKMEQMGIANVNVFMSAFMDMRSTFVVKADRTLAQEDVIEKFKNAKQLRLLIGEFIDYKGGDELGIRRPEKHQKKLMLPASPLQWDYMSKAEDLFTDKEAGGAIVAVTELQNITLSPYLSRYHTERFRTEKVSDEFYVLIDKKYVKVPGVPVKVNPDRETFACKNQNGVWSVCDTKTGILIGSGNSQEQAVRHAGEVFRNDRRHIVNISNYEGLSPRFKLEMAFDYAEFVNESPKIKWTMDAIKEVTAASKEANQIIYMPRGVEYHPLIKEYLVKELGFKDSEVEIVSGLFNTKEEEIEEVKQRFNAGEIKVLIGSEVIKEGMDLQKKTTDLYDLHLPWNPVDLDQVEGRAWRFGNEWGHVRINYPLIEDSVDPFIFQKLETKNKRIQHAKHATENEVDVSDLNFEELKLDLITDPARKKQAEKTMEMHRLSREANVAKAEMAHLEYKLKGRDQLTRKIRDYDQTLSFAKMRPHEAHYRAMAQSAEKKKVIYERKLVDLEKKLEGLDPLEVTKMLSDMQAKAAAKEAEARRVAERYDKEIETLKRCRPMKVAHNEMHKTERYQATLQEIRRENPVYLVKDAQAGQMELAEPAPLKVFNDHLLKKVDGLDDVKGKYLSFMNTLTKHIDESTEFELDVKKKIVDSLNSEAGAKLIANHSAQAEIVVYAGLCLADGGEAALEKYHFKPDIRKQIVRLAAIQEKKADYNMPE
jgi:superfamily II DNA or RNA helicase